MLQILDDPDIKTTFFLDRGASLYTLMLRKLLAAGMSYDGMNFSMRCGEHCLSPRVKDVLKRFQRRR